KIHSHGRELPSTPLLRPRLWKNRSPASSRLFCLGTGQTRRISTTVLRLRPLRVPSRKARSSRRSPATTPAVTAVERADSTWSRASPSSSRNLSSSWSRVMRSVELDTAIGVTCSLLGDAGDGPARQGGRHDEDDEVRHPGQGAVEGVAGLGLQRAQAGEHEQDHTQAADQRSGGAIAEVAADALQRLDRLLTRVVLGEGPQLGG